MLLLGGPNACVKPNSCVNFVLGRHRGTHSTEALPSPSVEEGMVCGRGPEIVT